MGKKCSSNGKKRANLRDVRRQKIRDFLPPTYREGEAEVSSSGDKGGSAVLCHFMN